MDPGRARGAQRSYAATLFVCTCALVLGLSGTARAQAGPELELTWQADPDCPDAVWAATSLRERLGRELARTAPSTLVARVELRAAGDRFELRLSTTRGDMAHERRLEAASCAELAQAAVLVVALAIEEVPPPLPTPPAPPQETPAAPAPAAPSPAAAPAPTAAPSSPGPRLAITAGPLLDVGFLPGPSVGPTAEIALFFGRVRVGAAGLWLPDRSSSPADGGASVRVGAWALRPLSCLHVWGDRLMLAPCVAFELGRARGRGAGPSELQERTWFYRAAYAGVRFSVLLRREVGLVFEPGLSIPLGRPRFVSAQDMGSARSTLHMPAPVSARITLGLELRF